LRALLRGDEVEWDGGVIKMLHWQGYGAARPINVPFLYAAGGPKGFAAAKAEADGVIVPFSASAGFDWSVALLMGTVLDDGEDPGSARVLDAAGHGGAVLFHYAVEHDQLDMIVGGKEWLASYEKLPQKTRHLTLHDGHLVGINDHDRAFISGELLAQNGVAMDRAAWRDRLAALEADGATEIGYQPAGADIPRELEAFASLVNA
jgi:5,10-methylenetetrahydromethanopterin reductase